MEARRFKVPPLVPAYKFKRRPVALRIQRRTPVILRRRRSNASQLSGARTGRAEARAPQHVCPVGNVAVAFLGFLFEQLGVLRLSRFKVTLLEVVEVLEATNAAWRSHSYEARRSRVDLVP